MKRTPDSRAARARAADALLRRLLRTPKTRAGLIAAVVQKDISRNFVYGWLSERTRDGTVTLLKATGRFLYQITENVVVENAGIGTFPLWMEPRCLPTATGRRLYIDGELTANTSTQEKTKKEV